MMWDNNEYCILKCRIYDEIVKGMNETHSQTISIKKVMDAIDELFTNLLSEEK